MTGDMEDGTLHRIEQVYSIGDGDTYTIVLSGYAGSNTVDFGPRRKPQAGDFFVLTSSGGFIFIRQSAAEDLLSA